MIKSFYFLAHTQKELMWISVSQIFQKDIYILLTRANVWKPLSVHLWVNGYSKYIHMHEYYSNFKKQEILMYTTIQMNLESTMLNEKSQLQKKKTKYL